jgi:hypothetical protein
VTQSLSIAGCKVIPCRAAVDGQAFAFEIKFPSGRQVHQQFSELAHV